MDKTVQKALLDFSEKHRELHVLGSIRSGKDAQVLLVKDRLQHEYALKVYKALNERFITDNQQFLAGRYYRNAGIRKKVHKKNNLGQNILKKVWTKREFVLLQQLYKQGAPVPKVIDWTENSLLMEFIGDKHSPALQLNEVLLTPTLAKLYKQEIHKGIELLLNNYIVHGDLSQYNILVHNSHVYIIDFPQALDIRTVDEEKWRTALENDKNNIDFFFRNKL